MRCIWLSAYASCSESIDSTIRQGCSAAMHPSASSTMHKRDFSFFIGIKDCFSKLKTRSLHLHKLPRLPAHRTALVDLRADLFVITSVANRKTTRTVGTTIENHTVAHPARRSVGARLAMAHEAGAGTRTHEHNCEKQSRKQNENRFEFHHRLVLTSIRSANKLKNF